jgi:hypothetical protein
MQENWLRPNRRILLFGMILPGVLVAVGLIAALGRWTAFSLLIHLLGWLIFVFGLILLVLVTRELKAPRLSYGDGNLLVRLRTREPIGVPIEFVECFFLGKGAGQLPGPNSEQTPVRNLIIRIAERAHDFQQQEVKPTLGRWEEGYVTIHGAWCEPLTLEKVQQLNARLAEAQKQAAQLKKAVAKS